MFVLKGNKRRKMIFRSRNYIRSMEFIEIESGADRVSEI